MGDPIIRLAEKFPSPEQRALEVQSFAIAFEFALEAMSEGTPLNTFCQSYHIALPVARFRTWIMRDPQRKKAYYAAKAVMAEQIEDDLLRISDGMAPDGTPSLSDVQRDTLRINVRKFILQVSNRERYGDVKRVEQTTTTRFDPTSASTMELQRKVLESLGFDLDNELPQGDIFENGETPDASNF